MRRYLLLFVALVLVLAGCGGPAQKAEKTQVRWFVGLGAGTDEPTIAAQEEIVKRYNESQDEIELVLEIVPNNQAYQTLATELSGGNAPDVVGPVGIRGRDSFKGAWIDLQPLVEKYQFDLSIFDAPMVDFYRNPGEGLLGLPFAIYPSFLYVNEELFEEAGIPLPPTEYGQPYVDENGKSWPWDMDTVKRIAVKLTVDQNGNDASSPDFDPQNIVQWGFGIQWTDARGIGTLFGPGTFVAPDGGAQIPPHWAEGWKWVYDGMWKSHFYPNGPYGSSDLLKNGDWFSSGRVAMVHCHLWYAGFAEINFKWNIYPVPAHKGKTTAKMHADTFLITKQSKNPDAAFKVLSYLVDDVAGELCAVYGGMPAKKELQGDFLEKFFEKRWPGQEFNLKVVQDSIQFADNPNHESWMPSFQEANTRYNQFTDLIFNNPDVDVDAEIQKLKEDLDKIFRAAQQ